MAYATAVTRLIYFRVPQKLPPADNIEKIARYWKRHYNTRKGKGDPAEFVRRYERYAA